MSHVCCITTRDDVNVNVDDVDDDLLEVSSCVCDDDDDDDNYYHQFGGLY